MKKPKISVIVPVYNGEKYLCMALDSLVNQTYENLEIIVIDDGSTDSTGEICDRYKTENENVIVIHQKNQGVSAARNAGLEKASGELIGFCDGDDTIDEDYFEYLYNQMMENDSDISSCCFEIISEKITFIPKSVEGKHLWNNDEFIRYLFTGDISIAIYDKLFRREVLDGIRFPENLVINEDKYFCFLAAMNAEKISYERVAKYHYYRREGTASMSAFSKKYFDMLEIAGMMYEITKEKKPHLTAEAQCSIIVAILILYKIMIRRNGMKKFPEYERKVYKYLKSFDKKTGKNHLRKNDYIRLRMLCASKKIFCIFTKLIDTN